MELFGPVLFVVALIIPALLLLAQVKSSRDGGQSSMSERDRVQSQRDQNLRRRFDERRHRVWSAMETAYMEFTTRQQDAPPLATRSDSARRAAQPKRDAPDAWNDLTDSRLAEMFDQFQTSIVVARQKSTPTSR